METPDLPAGKHTKNDIENGPVSGFSHIKHGGSFPSVLWQFTRPGKPEASHPP